MVGLANLITVLGCIGTGILAILLVIWWRQQSYRWPIVLLICLLLAPLLSQWSALVFQVPDYRAGCDGLCPGFKGAPVSIFGSDLSGSALLPGHFLLNSLIYLVVLLVWGAIMHAITRAMSENAYRNGWGRALVTMFVLLGPWAFTPLIAPPPEAQVRGDSQRVAINARREVYLYSHLAQFPTLRTGLVDVRPRPDGKQGLRVCFSTYSYFYWPTGFMYLDMTPEGVHSDAGGVLSRTATCWQ